MGSRCLDFHVIHETKLKERGEFLGIISSYRNDEEDRQTQRRKGVTTQMRVELIIRNLERKDISLKVAVSQTEK